jgi:para-nitrobenzyl esterase
MLPHGATPWPEEDLALARLMSTYWANFAKTGDPNGPGLPQWPAYDSEHGAAGINLTFVAVEDHARDCSYSMTKVYLPVREG